MARGDHLKVRRMGGLYTHHGIDMGDGTVVHFAGEPLRRAKAKVERAPLREFARGGKVRVEKRHNETRPPEEVVATAESRLGEIGYGVFLNNCEHFAHECKTGRRKSLQVQRAVAAGSAAAVALLAAGAVISISIIKSRISNNGREA